MDTNDTIAAVATAWGEGGVGIVRISGPGALRVAEALFRFRAPVRDIEPRRLYYGEVLDPEGASPVDDGFLVFMKGPSSYTGEDVVELHCHGGALVLRKVLDLVLRMGARPAEPGEFTRRAFMNGRFDLAQAEAVIDVIRAQTDAALASARGRLRGVFSSRVRGIKDILVGLLVRIEAELDFSEEEMETLSDGEILEGLDLAGEGLKRLLSTYDEGEALKYGIRALILGRPNVGKSSLLNVLLREERAIVTPVPGTTRDVIEEVVNIKGLPVRLMDTAGLRITADRVESVGVRFAKNRIKDAGLILFVIDSSCRDFTEDLRLLNGVADKKVIVVANKVDLVDQVGRGEVERLFAGYRHVFISALHDRGMDELREAVFEGASGHRYGAPGIAGDMEPGELVASARQRNSLEGALDSLEKAGDSVKEGLAREFAAADIRSSVTRLGEITGETTTEDILDRIFSEFCIGK